MDRRDFIKLTAVTGTSAALASCGNPEHQLIRFVPEEDIIPGIAQWKPSVCPVCSAGCAVNVRVMDADIDTVRNGQRGVVRMNVAKKLEGLPKDPISRGGLCARGQAAIQITYHPDRIAQPLKRDGARGGGQFKAIGWDEAIAELVSRLDALAASNDQKSLAIVARPRRGRRSELLAEFARRFGGPPPIAFDVFGDDVLRRANAVSFGHDQLPTFDLARSRYVIGFGADFLGTWNSPVAQNAAYGEMRQSRPGVRGKFVQVESRMTTTGACADEWIPVKPGTEGVLALGLVHLINRGPERAAPQSGASSQPGGPERAAPQSSASSQPNASRPADVARPFEGRDPSEYTPERVEQITGVPAKRVERIAKELAEIRPAVAIVGGPALAHTNAMFTALAVNALNTALGSVGQPGGLYFTPGVPPPAPSPQPRFDSAKILLVDDANPVYTSPKAWKVKEAIAKIPFVVSFGGFVDDTSVLADLILPDHSFLESWVQSAPESGSLEAASTVAEPVMNPIHNTRATAEVLIEVAGKVKSPVALPWKDAEELMKSSVVSPQPSVASRSPVVSRQSSSVASRSSRQPPAPSPRFEAPKFDGDASQYPFHFLPYVSPAFGDGSSAHLPWLQEMPDPLTSAMWSSWVEINPQTAQKLNVRDGDLVDLTSTQGTLRVPAVIFPGIAPDIVAMPVGQGHEPFTRYATGRGANAIGLIAPITEPETGALAWAATRVKVARAADANGSLILFAGETREHPHEYEVR
jgi:anaerobic selenocysteine-containing dehydrogenase